MPNSQRSLVDCTVQDLLPQVHLESLDPHHPVVVHQVPPPWRCLGTGNYAAVFEHPDYPDQVVKVYAPGRPGIEDEREVYRRLGEHPAFSRCDASGDTFLVLKRLHGVTLYDCLQRGVAIPPQVIRDIDAALDYARRRGLFPHDVHGRNVMMADGHGLVVDISDFLKATPCRAWTDVKRAYQWVYRPLILPLRLRVPYFLLDGVRAAYRLFRRCWPRDNIAVPVLASRPQHSDHES
ncbi:MAG: serine/threonine protein kinase [Cyanobacteria bacterium J06626_4]